jgi:hypothetical protein
VRLRANTYLRKFLLDFIRMLAPHIEEETIRAATRGVKTRTR